MGDHPSHDIAAEDIKDDIEVEVSPFGRSIQIFHCVAPPVPVVVPLR